VVVVVVVAAVALMVLLLLGSLYVYSHVVRNKYGIFTPYSGSFFETLYCQISINGPEHIADLYTNRFGHGVIQYTEASAAV
jgi:hypothetical protein